MYGLSLGVQRMNEILPSPVYALLSGLNSSTVGIIALAAVQLAEKAIKEKLTRILVIMGAVAGLCYNALWYFPTLMAIGGLAGAIWDGWLDQKIRKIRARLRRKRNTHEDTTRHSGADESIALEEGVEHASSTLQKRSKGPEIQTPSETANKQPLNPEADGTEEPHVKVDHTIRVRVGVALIVFFFGEFPTKRCQLWLINIASFIGVLVARRILGSPPLAFNLFANMYLAGTIIFGGGPVVIPLLRSYVVDPGWVSSRDFLLGLAIIQAFPGPNFNFAVYLGALALQKSQFHTTFGAFLGFLGIFFPGITLAVAIQSFWRVLRKRKWVIDILRGVNATAVGLVFTAVYRLWEIGYLTPEASRGQSLALEPWWVAVATLTYAQSAWFNVPPAMAIVIGAVLGLAWYGAVGR